MPFNPVQMFINQTPLGQIITAIRGLKGGNPMPAIGRMTGSNPIIGQGYQMMNGKSPAEVEQMARNMAQQRGVNVDDMIRQMGLR